MLICRREGESVQLKILHILDIQSWDGKGFPSDDRHPHVVLAMLSFLAQILRCMMCDPRIVRDSGRSWVWKAPVEFWKRSHGEPSELQFERNVEQPDNHTGATICDPKLQNRCSVEIVSQDMPKSITILMIIIVSSTIITIITCKTSKVSGHKSPIFNVYTYSFWPLPVVAQDEEKLTPHGHAMARCWWICRELADAWNSAKFSVDLPQKSTIRTLSELLNYRKLGLVSQTFQKFHSHFLGISGSFPFVSANVQAAVAPPPGPYGPSSRRCTLDERCWRPVFLLG